MCRILTFDGTKKEKKEIVKTKPKTGLRMLLNANIEKLFGVFIFGIHDNTRVVVNFFVQF